MYIQRYSSKGKEMNREDIIRMAREAGLIQVSEFGVIGPFPEHIERFAELVRAAERKIIMDSLQKQADLATDALDAVGRWK